MKLLSCWIISFLVITIFPLSSRAQLDASTDKSMRIKTITGDEELVIIQTISASKATFVIRKGAHEGVTLHQKALFSTDKVSILCKSIEVTKDYSLWQVADPNMQVPFSKRQYVVLNTSLETIWQKIPTLKEELSKRVAQIKVKPTPYWILRGSSARGLYSSVSNTGSQVSNQRVSLQGEISFNTQLLENVDMGIGIRGDKETTTQDSPNLVINTTRMFVTGELIYNFPDFSNTNNHFYSAAGGGIGASNTVVSETKSNGTAFLGPVFRFGLRTTLTEKYSLLVEMAAEAISMNETFADGTRQTTNIVNGKFSIGVRF